MHSKVTLILPCRGIDCRHGTRLQEAMLRLWHEGVSTPRALLIKDLPYGAAIKQGILLSSSRWIATMDTDGQHTWEDFYRLWNALQRAPVDMIVGTRPRRRTLRGASSCLLNLAASLLVGKRVPDLGSGLRLFRRTLALPLLPMLPDGFDFNATLTVAFLTKAYRVQWESTPLRQRRWGKSSVRFSDGVRALQSMARVHDALQHD